MDYGVAKMEQLGRYRLAMRYAITEANMGIVLRYTSLKGVHPSQLSPLTASATRSH